MAHALKCGPCLFEDVTVDPQHFCVDCLEYLCMACARENRRHKTLREHKLLGETELPQDATLFEEMKKLSHCSIHDDIELDQYCKNHNVLICLHCLKNDHRLCEDRIDLTKLLENEYASENVRERIFELQRKCQVQLTETMELSDAANTNSKEVEQHINTLVETLTKNVQNLEKKLNEERERLISLVTESVRLSMQTLSSIEKKAIHYANLFDVASTFGTMKHNVVLHFVVSMLMKDLEANDLLKKNSTAKIKCVQAFSSEEIVNMMGQFSLASACSDEQGSELCSDEALEEDSVRFPPPKTRTVATQVEELVDSHTKTSKKSLHKMKISYNNVKLLPCECLKRDDEFPPVIGLDVLTDGRILLLHERMIKVYSLKLVLVSKLSFDVNSYAKDMCVLEDKQDGVFTVALCLYRLFNCQITVMEYTGGFCEKYTIKCKYYLKSITLLGHHFLVVGSGPIQLLDISTGRVCYAFDDTMWASNGSKIDTNINRVRACIATKKIALACSDTVYRVNIEDDECQNDTLHAVCPFVWKYEQGRDSRPDIKGNKDVKCDSQGNMYIANTCGVYQFCPEDGLFKERPLITIRANCTAIAIDEHRNRIVVACSNSTNSNLIYVYEYELPASE